jgi:choline kinase
VKAECGEGISFVENDRYGETNSLYSLWLARDHLVDGFVVMNSDVLFHPALLRALLRAEGDAALLVSLRRDGDAPLGAEEMKIRLEGGYVREISKDLDPDDADGENIGIVRFGPRCAPDLVRYMDALVANGAERDWAPRAFQEFARHHDLGAVSAEGYPWIEIDFRTDYERAVREIAPRIAEHDALD